MDIDDLSIEQDIKDVLRSQGITTLYPPQEEALPAVLGGKNVVVAVPTAAGKSLVAYLAVLKAARSFRKSLYIVPLRALAQEKYDDLRAFEPLGVKVGISTGDLDQKGERLGAYDILVCTSEKADSLLRHRADWLADVGVVVADEVHLMNDASRGPTMEVNLVRFMLMQPVQIIALSATIKNARELADWLSADLVQSDWRPVPLREGVLFGRRVRFLDGTDKTIARGHIDGLLEDVLADGGQALVFVNTRRTAQVTAERLRPIAHTFSRTDADALKTMADALVREESHILSKKLAEGVCDGIAFHHAGLSAAHRKSVEQAFRRGAIKCIVATPTLAAGVNTPARRVIVNNLWRYSTGYGGMQPIPVLEIKQMMGRAGRPGFDEVGEAILVARNEIERDRLTEEYLCADTEPIFSKLAADPALRMHVLALVATEFAVYWKELLSFFKKTFYVHQLGMLPEERLWEILDFLERNGFIESAGERFRATTFGMKTVSLYLDPLSALKMKEALAGKTGKAFGYLHAVCATPDMRCLYVSKGDAWLQERAEQERLLLEPPEPYDQGYEWFLSEIKTASLLEDWINERTEDDMIGKYRVGPGDIHAKVETAEWLLHAMQELARLFNFDAVSPLMTLKMRVAYGCKKELLPLVALRGIGRVRARTLHRNGFKTIAALRKTPKETLARLPGFGPTVAQQIKEQVT
jgi:helicase